MLGEGVSEKLWERDGDLLLLDPTRAELVSGNDDRTLEGDESVTLVELEFVYDCGGPAKVIRGWSTRCVSGCETRMNIPEEPSAITGEAPKSRQPSRASVCEIRMVRGCQPQNAPDRAQSRG